MSKITTSIGLKFERFMQNVFQGLAISENPLVPDFSHGSGFRLEAKAGNVGWGVRIKDYQIRAFENSPESVFYALGFHDFDRAYERLTQKTERGRQGYLDDNLHFTDLCFMPQEFMKRLWIKERRTSEKAKISYCMIKKSTLNNVFANREFKRFGETVGPENYYDFSYGDYSMFNLNVAGIPTRGIVRKTGDEKLTEFLEKQGFDLNFV